MILITAMMEMILMKKMKEEEVEIMIDPEEEKEAEAEAEILNQEGTDLEAEDQDTLHLYPKCHL